MLSKLTLTTRATHGLKGAGRRLMSNAKDIRFGDSGRAAMGKGKEEESMLLVRL